MSELHVDSVESIHATTRTGIKWLTPNWLHVIPKLSISTEHKMDSLMVINDIEFWLLVDWFNVP